jgi:hypothetical protein
MIGNVTFNAGYCHGMVMRIANVLPVWTGVRPPEAHG